MTRDEAVKIWLAFGCHRTSASYRRRVPQHIADRDIMDNAEDCVEGLIALGLLDVDSPSPQGSVEDK